MLDVYFETYGCTANYNSTEIMRGIVVNSGLNLTSDIKRADIIVINSCIVKEPTEEKIRRRVSDLLKNFQDKKIILAGCMPRINKERLQKDNLYLIDTSQIKNLSNLIKDIYNNDYEPEKYLKKRNETKLCLPKSPEHKLIGITQISEGCLGNCSYCITRFAKGKLFSYPEEKIIESVKSDLNAGCREIWLTSQDNASYGLDFEEPKRVLPELINKIISLPHRFYLRIGMMNPDNVFPVLDELIEVYKNKKVFKFLHIPVQSGSNRILKSMNRNYTKEDFLKIINSFRREFPDIHISTDVIIGYPGETEEDFNETFNLIKEIRPETINMSKFWPRPGTPAAAPEFQSKKIPQKELKKRVLKIARLHKEICIKEQEKFLNTIHNVLVDQKGLPGFPNTYLGRNQNYKLFAITSDKKILGKQVNLIVKRTTPHYLISKVVE
ncbi:MAG: tRNA (N(6)-L-threonylcarbamoyladenosine(37)-C(2))-methylthiotransferase [Minisyncoccales bacterium]